MRSLFVYYGCLATIATHMMMIFFTNRDTIHGTIVILKVKLNSLHSWDLGMKIHPEIC